MADARPQRSRRPPIRFRLEDVVNEVINDSDSDYDPDNDSEHESTESDEEAVNNITVGDDTATDTDEGWTQNDVNPVIPLFSGQPGMKLDIMYDSSPLVYLDSFISEEMYEHFSQETNRYAEQCQASDDSGEHSRGRLWHATTATEIKRFIAVLFAMGLVNKPSYRDYWSSDPVLCSPFYGMVMSRDRFFLLLRYFHVNNNENTNRADKLRKCRYVIDNFQRQFRRAYYPERDVSIDETMVPWTGRLAWKQYIPNKPVKYGMKLYQLCESKTGYTYAFKVYTGNYTFFHT